jgi:hypothetical protein
MHCTYGALLASGPRRKADMLAMLDPDFNAFLTQKRLS